MDNFIPNPSFCIRSFAQILFLDDPIGHGVLR